MESNIILNQKWEVEFDSSTHFAAVCKDCTTFKNIHPGIIISSGEKLFPQSGKLVTSSGNSMEVEYSYDQDITAKLKIAPAVDQTWLRFDCEIINQGEQGLPLKSILPLGEISIDTQKNFDRILYHGDTMNDLSGVRDIPEALTTHACFGISNSEGNGAVVAGFCDLKRTFCRWNFEQEIDEFCIVAETAEEDIALKPGASVTISNILLGCGNSLSKLIDQYAQESGREMSALKSEIMTGWCSWYNYYGKESQQDILDELEGYKSVDLIDQIKVIQIDDGWNQKSNNDPRVWGDWHAGGKFPQGMKYIADKIRDAGCQPGLWLAPFSVDPDSQLFKEHPDWLVQDENGPKLFWGVYGLDLTHPEALNFVRETFERVFNEWGFEYIKIDFLLHAIQPGKRFNPDKTTAELFRDGLKVIRDVAKDRFILGCSSPMSPWVGLCDAMRIGPDVSARWYIPFGLDGWPEGNCNVRAGMVYTIGRLWMNRRWWQNDPDCIQVREYASQPEIEMFEKLENGAFAKEPPYGLSYEEASCFLRLIWFIGAMTITSESAAKLSPDRLELMKKAFPPNPEIPRWVDWYPDPYISVMKSEGQNKMIGIFNLKDEPITLNIPILNLELSSEWSFREWLTEETFSGSGEIVNFPELPPHAGRIWILN